MIQLLFFFAFLCLIYFHVEKNVFYLFVNFLKIKLNN